MLSDAIRAAALSLHVDTVTAEVVTRLDQAGIRSILLKGPSIAAWLYADGAPRPYGDTDLLVSAQALAPAQQLLGEAGFRRGQPGWQEVSRAWERPDGATVDLHTSLFAVGARPDRVWEELASRTERMRVGGREIEVLAQPALAFHVALHAAHHGSEDGTPRRDLERALAIADAGSWRQAAALASKLEARPVFATGLRLCPEGVRLADELGVLDEGSALTTLHAGGSPPLVLGLEHLAAAPGGWARLRFLVRKLLPAPAELRARSALAGRGVIGLALAYLWRPVWLSIRLPGAFRAWCRVRSPASGRRAAR